MGRQNGDATVASSSIALLQERFRELQRIREKRQEKELLKLFSSSESERSSPPAVHFDLPNNNKLTTFQPEMNRAPALQDSLLSLRLNSQSSSNNNNNHHYHHPDFRAINNPTSLWPNSATTGSSSRSFENSDVDTSLHL